jgi:hypothetical protein
MFPDTTLTECHPDSDVFTAQGLTTTKSTAFPFLKQCTVSPFIAEYILQPRLGLKWTLRPLELF